MLSKKVNDKAEPEAAAEDVQSIWQALDAWAKVLAPWQRRILAYATKHGRLSDAQIDEVYGEFLIAAALAPKPEKEKPAEPIEVSGRPAAALADPLVLTRIDQLRGVNALPEDAALTFGANLTVVYGRNGSGKTGFARLLANACFSRHKPAIIKNIYDKNAPAQASAQFHVRIGGQAREPLPYAVGNEIADLQRITFFDSTVARQHVSGSTTFEFKPSGFDVFPEIVRVYAEISKRLDAEVARRTRENTFPKSFIAEETAISKAMDALGAKTDMAQLRAWGAYGDSERARLADLDTQLTALKAKSAKELLAAANQAKADIGELFARLKALATEFGAAKAAARTELSRAARQAADDAAALGSDQFKRPFFNAVGTPEWEAFTKAAHALGRKEHEAYPTPEESRCLLCERPFDDASRKHVAALLAFVEGDARRKAALADKATKDEANRLDDLEVDIFSANSRVRAHVHRLDPELENKLEAVSWAITSAREAAVRALKTHAADASSVDIGEVSKKISGLLKRLDDDIARLGTEDTEKAIASLELERRTLRHREVLSQILPDIETFVADAIWCEKVPKAKTALAPRPITDKEKELFIKVVGDSYRKRFADECDALGCALPVELQTVGRAGQTVRSLAMKGGHKPDTILSEGEQRAVALADFLAEVGHNPASNGIVLDDPVTSQDHERKARIAERLVQEAKNRQVIVFTHDLVFLNQIAVSAEGSGVPIELHWIDRTSDGKPGKVALGDAPTTSKMYDSCEKARQALAHAKTLTGSAQTDAIRGGMGALRRTIEETVAKKFLKEVVSRWSDRVMVTALRKIVWDDALGKELVETFEKLSAYIEGHSHTDEAAGAPPQIKDLEQMIPVVEGLIKRARAEKQKAA